VKLLSTLAQPGHTPERCGQQLSEATHGLGTPYGVLSLDALSPNAAGPMRRASGLRARQTIAGAIFTGTHCTGAGFGGRGFTDTTLSVFVTDQQWRASLSVEVRPHAVGCSRTTILVRY
jgi:hypothetical protein